jgi:peptidoglycan/xylan/chitin deacetylase (PgdA/CDA1 family)
LGSAGGGVVVILMLAVVFGGGSSAVSRRPARVLPAAVRRRRDRPVLRPLRSAIERPANVAAGYAEIRRLRALALPIYCGGRRGSEVAFTFDDGPGPYTYLAIRKLMRAGERATFFVVGKSIDSYSGFLPRELKIGAIGDHTYTHPLLTMLPAGMIKWQLERTAEKIQAQSGERVDLWRPPYEAHNPTVVRIARHLGLLEVFWSVDSQDSLGANWQEIVKNVGAGLRPGAIVLMHENRGQTIRALTRLLPELRRRHLRSVSLPELFATDPPSVAQVRRGWTACGTAASTPGRALASRHRRGRE